MQQAPAYGDVAAEVAHFLADRARRLCGLGVQPDRIVVDPGIGFGKTLAHNVRLHRQLQMLQQLGFPVLVGWSRKSALGTITGKPVHDRVAASVSAALAAAQRGAKVLRVHDVAATVDALKVWQALELDGADVPASAGPSDRSTRYNP
jgi:dihydropteroate synthase